MTSIQTIRDVYFQEIAFRNIKPTNEQVVGFLENIYQQHLETPPYPDEGFWSPSWRIWAGIGLALFGKIEYAEKVIQDCISYPTANCYKPCRYYVCYFDTIFSVPDHLRPKGNNSLPKNAAAVLEWFQNQNFVWNYESSQYEVKNG